MASINNCGTFTQNWFESLALKNFETLKTLVDINKPINYLEIGCYEGNCHKWMYENILLNSSSKSTVIDPFEKSLTHPDSYSTFTTNLSDHLNKIIIHKGFSDDVLPTLEKESFDIIYVDGDHTALAAYNDGVNSFPLLKPGGILIFDDYLWYGPFGRYPSVKFDRCVGGEQNPCKGVNKFFEEYKNKVSSMEGFTPPCNIIDIDRLYSDENYKSNCSNIFNYQLFCIKN